jgi:hypothetical protein
MPEPSWFVLSLSMKVNRLKISKTFTKRLVMHLALILTYHFTRRRLLLVATTMH